MVVLANVIVPWLVTMLLPFKNVSNTPLPLRFWIMLLVVFVNTPFTSNWLRVPAPFVALNEIVPLFMYRLLLEKVAAVAPKLALPIWTVPLLPSKVVPVTLNTCELRIIKNPRPEARKAMSPNMAPINVVMIRAAGAVAACPRPNFRAW